MNRKDDTSMKTPATPPYDNQGNPVNQEDTEQEDRDLFDLGQQDDEPM